MPNTTTWKLWVRVQNQIPGGVLGALIILIVGWVIARLLQAGVTAGRCVRDRIRPPARARHQQRSGRDHGAG